MAPETFDLLLGSVGRWFSYAATFLVIGFAGARLVELRAGHEGLANLRVGLFGAIALALFGGWRLFAHTYSIFGIDEPVTWEYVRLVALDTGWGRGWQAQVIAAIAAVVLIAASGRSFVKTVGPLVAAVGVSATWPITGHAVAETNPVVGTALQSAHILATGFWIGTLAVLLWSLRLAGQRNTDNEVFTRAINAFSPIAVGAVACLAAVGVITSWLYLDSVAALWETAYGRMLSVKIALFGLVGVVGAYNWRSLKPRLGLPGAADRLKRSARVELALAGVVLAVTAVLVVLPIMTSG